MNLKWLFFGVIAFLWFCSSSEEQKTNFKYKYAANTPEGVVERLFDHTVNTESGDVSKVIKIEMIDRAKGENKDKNLLKIKYNVKPIFSNAREEILREVFELLGKIGKTNINVKNIF